MASNRPTPPPTPPEVDLRGWEPEEGEKPVAATVDPTPRRIRVLSDSALSTKRRCDERFRLKYLERLEPVDADTEARDLGSAVHEGLAEGDPLAAARYIFRVAQDGWPGEAEDLARKDWLQVRAAVAVAMVTGALAHWTEWPTAVEEQFEVPLRNPATGSPSTSHRLGGRWDGLWDDGDPHPTIEGDLLLEIKTSSRVSRDYFARLRIDSQPTTYMEAVSLKVGRPVRQALYRIIRKPGIKRHRGESEQEYQERVRNRKPLAPLKRRVRKSKPPAAQAGDWEPQPDGTWEETLDAYAERSDAREGKREPLKRRVEEPVAEYIDRLRVLYTDPATADAYFYEERVTRSEDQMERWRAEVWEEHRRILAIERGEMTIRNAGSCLDYGRCDYFDLCTGEVGVEGFRVRKRANPELSEKTSGSTAGDEEKE